MAMIASSLTLVVLLAYVLLILCPLGSVPWGYRIPSWQLLL